ncbi:hypothetical protein HYALB_00013356 [Hymenoscyphus albidus]|uniref:Uncharacterized protein n=1 Tax=Hymenoscyphus albidus TaxID=595503 RepID=A0A9N9LVQ1_9HELO|nr:hypothetical protein HYALB_00013356 [Hymenoscyphus albidus]
MSKTFPALSITGKNYASSATCNYVFLPLYDYGSAYGITAEIDRAIIGLSPDIILESCYEIQSRLDKRLSHVSHILPLRETSILCKRMFSSARDSRLDFALTTLDLKSIPGKLIHDITSTPLHCALLIVEMRHINTERRSAGDRIFKDLLDSLELATHSVFSMLANLYRETPDSLRIQISTHHGFGVFLALGMLFEAYGSRCAPVNTVYLLSGHVLEREHCSGHALTHFKTVCKLRKYILSVLEPSPEGVGAEIQIWEHLLERLLTALNSFPCVARYDDNHPHWLGLISVLHNEANSLPEVMGTARFQRLLDRL